MPNLVWKDSQGKIRENPFTNVPTDLDNVMVDHYGMSCAPSSGTATWPATLPFKDWLRYPITAVLTCRGCTQNCVICGGSGAAFRKFYNRDRPAFRSPKRWSRISSKSHASATGPSSSWATCSSRVKTTPHEVLSLLQKSR